MGVWRDLAVVEDVVVILGGHVGANPAVELELVLARVDADDNPGHVLQLHGVEVARVCPALLDILRKVVAAVEQVDRKEPEIRLLPEIVDNLEEALVVGVDRSEPLGAPARVRDKARRLFRCLERASKGICVSTNTRQQTAVQT